MKTDRINELVNLLHRSGSPALAELRAKYPSSADDLAVGGVLGAPPPKLRLEVALAALKTFRPEAEKLLPRIRQKLQRSHRWDGLAQILAVAGGGTILFAESIAKTVGGTMALVGGLASLAVKVSRKDFAGVDGGLQKVYAEIGEITWKARETELRLEHYISQGEETMMDDVSSLIAEANEFARRMNEFIRDYA